MAVSPALIAALIHQVALPEILAWLKSRQGNTITDADILAKLQKDTAEGIAIGEAWLAAHQNPTP